MDGHTIEQHQYLGIAHAAHLGLVSGRVGLGGRNPCEVQAWHAAQQLVQRLRR